MSDLNHCAGCGIERYGLSCMNGPAQRQIQPGDLLVCDKCRCIQVLEPDNTMRAYTEEEIAALPEQVRIPILITRAIFKKDDWIQFMKRMKGKMQDWLSANPEREVLVTFADIGKNVHLAIPISEALRMGVLKVNPAGRELIEHMAAIGTHEEATIGMVQALFQPERSYMYDDIFPNWRDKM